VSGGQHL